MKSLLLSGILNSPKNSIISKRKGSCELYSTLPRSTRSKTTAKQNFFLHQGVEGWNSAA
jgi:hypothetical protein